MFPCRLRHSPSSGMAKGTVPFSQKREKGTAPFAGAVFRPSGAAGCSRGTRGNQMIFIFLEFGGHDTDFLSRWRCPVELTWLLYDELTCRAADFRSGRLLARRVGDVGETKRVFSGAARFYQACVVKGTAAKSRHSGRGEESRLSGGATARFFGPQAGLRVTACSFGNAAVNSQSQPDRGRRRCAAGAVNTRPPDAGEVRTAHARPGRKAVSPDPRGMARTRSPAPAGRPSSDAATALPATRMAAAGTIHLSHMAWVLLAFVLWEARPVRPARFARAPRPAPASRVRPASRPAGPKSCCGGPCGPATAAAGRPAGRGRG